MTDDTENLLVKTWARSVDPINKLGFMDGASAGQEAVFQSSFDVGYEQGIEFGLLLGKIDSICSLQETTQNNANIHDPRKINCQICLNTTSAQENIGNLFNKQREKNEEYFEKYNNLDT